MQWCEGQQERASRELASGERERVAAWCRRATWRALGACACVPLSLCLVPILGILILEIGRPPPPLGEVIFGVGAFLALLLAFPAAILTTRDAVRDLAALRRDLRDGVVTLFGEGDAERAVLPHSRRLLARGGIPETRPRKVELGHASAVPSEAKAYAIPLADIPAALQSQSWEKRALTPEERGEIERHAARFGKPPVVLVLLTAVGAALAKALVEGPPQPVAWLWILVLGTGWWSVLRGRALRKRFHQDLDHGWAMRATAGNTVGDELLPVSGARWTQQGAPARWRLSP